MRKAHIQAVQRQGTSANKDRPMPKRKLGLVVKPPIQKGKKPYVFFRGPIVDAGGRFDICSIPEERIAETFRMLGFTGFPADAPAKLKKGLEEKVAEMRKKREREALFFLKLNPTKVIPFKVIVSEKRHEIVVHQQPVVHSIIRESPIGTNATASAFHDLKNIIAHVFTGQFSANSVITLNRKGAYSPKPDTNKGITGGDGYSIEIMKSATPDGLLAKDQYFIKRANPKKIIRVNIYFDPRRNSETEKEYAQRIAEKKEFYRQELKGQTLRFIPP
jgi:hypothetical protein